MVENWALFLKNGFIEEYWNGLLYTAVYPPDELNDPMLCKEALRYCLRDLV